MMGLIGLKGNGIKCLLLSVAKNLTRTKINIAKHCFWKLTNE